MTILALYPALFRNKKIDIPSGVEDPTRYSGALSYFRRMGYSFVGHFNFNEQCSEISINESLNEIIIKNYIKSSWRWLKEHDSLICITGDGYPDKKPDEIMIQGALKNIRIINRKTGNSVEVPYIQTYVNPNIYLLKGNGLCLFSPSILEIVLEYNPGPDAPEPKFNIGYDLFQNDEGINHWLVDYFKIGLYILIAILLIWATWTSGQRH